LRIFCRDHLFILATSGYLRNGRNSEKLLIFSGKERGSNSMSKFPGLYSPSHEHDSCGVGFVANVDGSRSHEIVGKGLQILQNLIHRGAVGSDNTTGDGAGILLQISEGFFLKTCLAAKVELPEDRPFGAAMIFMPRDPRGFRECGIIVESTVRSENLGFLGWREVPVNEHAVSGQAYENRPRIMQCFIDGGGLDRNLLERKLYITRRLIEKKVADVPSESGCFHISSMSCRTIVYKGMFTAPQLPDFYLDLQDSELDSAVALVHQRYSTNTFPSWKLAQPFRYLAHNGEINTLRGNLNHLRSRESSLESALFGEDIKKLLPIAGEDGSDSSYLDNMLELLTLSGRSIDHSILMLIPEAWGVKYPMGPDLRGFFEYHAGIMEPWDGPAAVIVGNRFGSACSSVMGLPRDKSFFHAINL
jgi:glutamate synthase domain-containing protein 1